MGLTGLRLRAYGSPIGNTAERTEKGKEMTRKDYELLAGAIRYAINLNTYHPEAQQRLSAIDSVINEIAACLANDNPRFDRERFAMACLRAE